MATLTFVENIIIYAKIPKNDKLLSNIFSFSAPGDYAESMEIFTFSPTESRFAITILINNDDILERTEQFFARAQLVSSDAPGGIIMPDESVITILDEDGKWTIIFIIHLPRTLQSDWSIAVE